MRIGQNLNTQYLKKQAFNTDVTQSFLGARSGKRAIKSVKQGDEYVGRKNAYINELKKLNEQNPYITDEEELKDLVLLYRTYKNSEDPNDRQEAYEMRDNVALSYMNLIVKEACKSTDIRQKYCIFDEDLIGEASLAVYQAIETGDLEKFRPAGNVKNAITNFIANNAGIVPVSIHKRVSKKVVSGIEAELRQKLMREPYPEEVEEKILELIQKDKKNRRILNEHNKPMHSFVPVLKDDGDDDEKYPFDIPDKSQNPHKQYFSSQLADELIKFVKGIKNKRKVVRENDKPDEFRQDLLTHSAGVEIITGENGKPMLDHYYVESPDEPLSVKFDELADKYGASRKAMKQNYYLLQKELPKTEGYERLDKEFHEKPRKGEFTPILEDLKKGKLDKEKARIVKRFILDTDALSGREKYIIAQRYFNGNKNISDIADESGLSQSMVHLAIHQATRELNKSSVFSKLAKQLGIEANESQ